MKNADKLVYKLINLKSGTDFEDVLARAVESVEAQKSLSTGEMIAEIAENYRFIIRKLTKEPFCIQLASKDFSTLVIDGECYDLDQLFPHCNRIITECRMAIDSLTADLISQGYDRSKLVNEVERLLNL